MNSDHVFSGWPGAFCLSCGENDREEICAKTFGHARFCEEEECQNEPCEVRGKMIDTKA